MTDTQERHDCGTHVTRDAAQWSVPWWALVSATAAPVLFIGGWSLAAALQPHGFNPVTQTISALAAYGATDRWLMTAALYAVGVCHLVTSLGLRVAATPGRWALGCGGAASIVIASFPESAGGVVSIKHITAVVIGALAMALWPVLSRRRQPGAPGPLHPLPAIGAALLILALNFWFLAEAHDNGAVGLAERVDGIAQSLLPLLVAVAATCQFRRMHRRARQNLGPAPRPAPGSARGEGRRI